MGNNALAGDCRHPRPSRMVSVQNEYSLLCRHFDLDMAEVAHHEKVGLLAFSPLAAGLLTGKYNGDVTPEGRGEAMLPILAGEFAMDYGRRLMPIWGLPQNIG